MKVAFTVPDISELEIQEVAEALRSGWITTGPRTKRLEKNIAQWLGVSGCACLGSQTACAEMSLRLLGIGEGDEVITTAYTYTASASVVCHVGARLVLVDTQRDSIELDYDALEKAITEKTKAIIPVAVAGIPCNYNKIFEIINKKSCLFQPKNDFQKKLGRIAVVADTAHSLGARLDGAYDGSFADFSCFSFHAVKNFTTAEGGAVTWNAFDGISNEEIYKQFQLLSLHGQNKDAYAKEKLGSWEYDIIGTWYKCNMTDVAAAIGLKQLERYPNMLVRRRQIIEKYNNAFKPLGIQVLEHYNERYESSGHLYLTRVPNISEAQRNEIIVKMAEREIFCNVHYKPLPMFTAYKNLGFDIKDYPNAYDYFKNEITLPLYTLLTEEQIDYVISTYIDIVKEYI